MTNTLTFALLTVGVLITGCKSTNNIQHATEQSIETPTVSTDGNARAEAHLNEAGRNIRMQIKNGEMTEEEGRAMYAGIAKRVEKRMTGTKKSKTVETDLRARYQDAADKMAEMVKAGEITREQMEMRLGEMRKRMGQSGERNASRKDQDSMKARYQDAADKMAEMVKAGEITREQMEIRLGEMRKRMGESSERSPSDAGMRARTWLEETGREIRNAVENGDLTPEEGRAKYAEAELRVKERLESKESNPR
ncbi:MAG: hypothetical protein VX615_04600 [Planctomycetota bacterium]|nr:hypothetical protein [Planctomycetota bacterium]